MQHTGSKNMETKVLKIDPKSPNSLAFSVIPYRRKEIINPQQPYLNPNTANNNKGRKSMLLDIALIAGTGLISGTIAERLKLPRLIGMIICGITIGPYALNLLSPEFIHLGSAIRTLALIIILTKAGLGLDLRQITEQGSVTLRLGVLPVAMEATILAISTQLLLGWDWLSCWILGWIICAESPAVIVPSMLKLKSEGWGEKHGVPDLILAGGTLTDVVAITIFGVLIELATAGAPSIWPQLWSLPIQIIGGIVTGYLGGHVIYILTSKSRLTSSPVQDTLLTLVVAVALVVGGEHLGYSGYLSAMTLGFTIQESSLVSTRRVRTELERAWVVAEIFLFVLIGVVVDTRVIFGVGITGLVILAIGAILGKVTGVVLSTLGSKLTLKERVFMVMGTTPKATVQAAIGAIPLTLGLPYGEVILAMTVLSILVTAPIGALGISWAAPRLLEKGRVDPTKVTVNKEFRFLVALSDTPNSMNVLQEATEIARKVDAKLCILNVREGESKTNYYDLNSCLEGVGDLEHDAVIHKGNPSELIIEEAERVGADYIFLGKGRTSGLRKIILGDIAEQVVVNSRIPVILVDYNGDNKIE
jgi:solute carrier family 9B (sodium/hydrogen exchanger), member 1/2